MCSPEKTKKCKEENNICVVENNEEKCEPDCEKTCPGKCVEDDNNKKHCICLNGGIPGICDEPEPLCNDLLCENGYCVVENGKAKCECDDENLDPSTCTKCSEKCKEHETCDTNGKCVCANGGTKPCKPFCSKHCRSGYRMVDRNENCLCNCLYGGKASTQQCRRPACTLDCNKNEVCIRDEDGEEKCVCSNLKESCTKCDKECSGGKCAIIDGEETCLCSNGSKDYPTCRIPKKSCPGGKAIFDRDGTEICVCLYESKKSSIYPNCKKFPKGRFSKIRNKITTA